MPCPLASTSWESPPMVLLPVRINDASLLPWLARLSLEEVDGILLSAGSSRTRMEPTVDGGWKLASHLNKPHPQQVTQGRTPCIPSVT